MTGGRRQPGPAAASVLAFGLLLAIAVSGSFNGIDPLAQDSTARLQRPSVEHPFGTDGFGRDVFTRVAHGLRSSLLVASLALGFSLLIGVPLGIAPAMMGGRAEELVVRLVDLLLALPSFLLTLIVVIAIGPSVLGLAAAIAVTGGPRIARGLWAEAASLRSSPFLLAARAMGVSPWKRATRHVLPSVRRNLAATSASLASSAIVTEATLGFLGLGVPPPFPSLGRMLLEGSRQYFESAPWVTLFPGLVISLCGIAFLLAGEWVVQSERW